MREKKLAKMFYDALGRDFKYEELSEAEKKAWEMVSKIPFAGPNFGAPKPAAESVAEPSEEKKDKKK